MRKLIINITYLGLNKLKGHINKNFSKKGSYHETTVCINKKNQRKKFNVLINKHLGVVLGKGMRA